MVRRPSTRSCGTARASQYRALRHRQRAALKLTWRWSAWSARSFSIAWPSSTLAQLRRVAPQLDEYGEGFAAYIEGFAGTEGLPYLSELARLDWQIGALGRLRCDAEAGARVRLEGGVQLHFASPMCTLHARFAVDQLRSAILSEDLEALRAIRLEPAEHHHVLWRSEAGVNVSSVSAASARFIEAALAGADGAEALEAAAAVNARAEDVASTLAREILPAGFVRVHAGAEPAA